MVEMNLSMVKPGDKVKVTRIEGDMDYRRRVMDMGVIRGRILDVIRVAPLGDPMELKVQGYMLSLRKDEVKGIYVLKVNQDEGGEKKW